MEKSISIASTPTEIQLSDNDVIISRTDNKGRITYASDDFARISEFHTDEMIGKPHNIIRAIRICPNKHFNKCGIQSIQDFPGLELLKIRLKMEITIG
jgi:PAS domain-containing protein